MAREIPELKVEFPRRILDEARLLASTESSLEQRVSLLGVELLLDPELPQTDEGVREHSGLPAGVLSRALEDRPVIPGLKRAGLHRISDRMQHDRSRIILGYIDSVSDVTSDFDELLDALGGAYEQVANPAAAYRIREEDPRDVLHERVWMDEVDGLLHQLRFVNWAADSPAMPKQLTAFAEDLIIDLTAADIEGLPLDLAGRVRDRIDFPRT